MAEIKNTFTAGKMNKDLDERLVPKGEYTDAWNVQVRTSNGGSVGVVHNMLGNEVTLENPYSGTEGEQRSIGSVVDEVNNCIYFLIASPDPVYSEPASRIKYADLIVQQRANGITKPVVVDLFAIKETRDETLQTDVDGEFTSIDVVDAVEAGYRVGMEVQAIDTNGDNIFAVGTKVKAIDGNTVILDRQQDAATEEAVYFLWRHEGALKFNVNTLITGVNVLEDFLFWTDNRTEPKKINIKRCKEGTPDFYTHTKLMLKDNDGNYVESTEYEVGGNSDLVEDHITTIKKAPLVAPNLVMSTSSREGVIELVMDNNNAFGSLGSGDLSELEVGDEDIVFNFTGTDFEVGDTVTLTSLNPVDPGNESQVKFKLLENLDGYFRVMVLNTPFNLSPAETQWLATLDDVDPLFELKFPRFGYRYKYEDNEYSTFSPWSEIAFIAGDYDYHVRKSYNLGMVNNLRSLKIKDFLLDDRVCPDDIKAIDILYKSTDSPVVYVLKTITRGLDPEWDIDSNTVGEIEITSDMVHKALPSNQILRAWDNVPRFAKAQEITGNRLLFGNYVQGYDVPMPVSIMQSIVSKPISNNDFGGKKSIKSLRSYKVGLVLGDKYGRETPVIGTGNRFLEAENEIIRERSDIYLSKEFCDKQNSLLVQQGWSTPDASYSPPEWVDYVRYYVKETSNEYYNLVMDRWYDAQDGNLWISFSSSDRNKVDEETYLILKSENGTNAAVKEKARYKIIAIENEAPDFIKTDIRSLGEFKVDAQYANLSANNEPLDLMYYTKFLITGSQWQNYFAGESYNFKGVPKIRLVAKDVGDNTLTTQWVTLSKITPPTTSFGTAILQEAFGSSANFPSLFVSAGWFETIEDASVTGAILYSFEVADFVVENKPEFDGRFFVKLEKDVVLENKVTQTANSLVTYQTTDIIRTGYINSYDVANPALNGPFSGWSDGSINDIFNGDQSFAFADSGSATNTNATRNFWLDRKIYIASQQSDGVGSTRLFIDDARSPENTHTEPSSNRTKYGGLGSSGDNGLNGTRDIISLSISPGGVFEGAYLTFKNKMTTPGTLFRFREDPNQCVYRVTSVIYNINNIQNYNHPDLQNSQYNENTNKRARITVKFRRVDQNSNSNTSEGIDISVWDPRGIMRHDGRVSVEEWNGAHMEILERISVLNRDDVQADLSGVFETEPKEGTELDIYYEASSSIPARLNNENTIIHMPLGSNLTRATRGKLAVNANGPVISVVDTSVEFDSFFDLYRNDVVTVNRPDGLEVQAELLDYVDIDENGIVVPSFRVSTYWDMQEGDSTLSMPGGMPGSTAGISVGMHVYGEGIPRGTRVVAVVVDFSVELSNNASATINEALLEFVEYTGRFSLNPEVWQYPVKLNWYNCFMFNNGVESDRIRDDFNEKTIDNGVAASTTLLDYGEERRSTGLIYSGIYNSNSGVNELNEFNMAEKITKDLNPSYGSIQALKTRNTDVVTFTEDKVLKVLSNKDALFNADGNVNLTATDRVLGQAIPFAGDYGISKNPESLCVDEYRMYFTDKARGAVLRLSMDGLTPISNIGMRSWFRDNLRDSRQLIGTYDAVSEEYNLSIVYWPGGNTSLTVTFNEESKGWVSFKSFVAACGGTVSGVYFTSPNSSGDIYRHYSENVNRNTFYGVKHNSKLSFVFNEAPGSVKKFQTMNYEGTQAKINAFTTVEDVLDVLGRNLGDLNDGEYYNLVNKQGWWVSDIFTNLQEGTAKSFKDKEGKWFDNITGPRTTLANLDTSEFTVQGLSMITRSSDPDNDYEELYELVIQDDPNE